MDIKIRRAQKADLPQILALYAQPDMDDGDVLDIPEAENIYERMSRYPDYHVYVSESEGAIVGTFALAILDNLAHKGTPSGLIEDVVVANAYQGKKYRETDDAPCDRHMPGKGLL
jgi:N-acetylglutamate synthase-like GNAT family acetyltransferase